MRMFIALLLLTFVHAAAAKEVWHLLKPDGLGFSIEFPSEPRAEEQDVDISNGKSVKMRTFQLLTAATSSLFDVTLADYPAGSVASIGEDQALNNARDGALGKSEFKLNSETKIDYAGRPARELIVTMGMGLTLRSHIFIVGDRLYNVGHIAAAGNERSETAEKFFASFKLIDAPLP